MYMVDGYSHGGMVSFQGGGGRMPPPPPPPTANETLPRAINMQVTQCALSINTLCRPELLPKMCEHLYVNNLKLT